MNEEKLIKTVNALLFIAAAAIITGITHIEPRQKEEAPEVITEETEVQELPGSEGKTREKKEPNPAILKESELRNIWQNVGASYKTMETSYIGQHYITAYCPEECGYRVYEDGTDNFPKGWITSTGTTCHREAEWYEPSTCGIATDFHRYGELFLIDGKVYVAEDTGLISGPWIDLFMPSYEEMSAFGSHWTDVYSVEFEEHQFTAEERKVFHERFNHYLHFGSGCGRVPFRCDR